MQNKNYLGRINNSNFKGEFVLFFEDNISKELKIGESVIVEIDGKPIPFFIEEYRTKNNKTALIKFDDIISESRIRKLTNAKVYLYRKSSSKRKSIPKENLDKFIGFKLTDQNHGYIGEVKEVVIYSRNIILSVYHNNKEILIPFDEDIVVDIDEENKTMTSILPEGLLEIYL